MANKSTILAIAAVLFSFGIILNYFILYYQWLGVFGRFIVYMISFSLFIFFCIIIHFFGPVRYKYLIKDWETPENQYVPENYDKSKWNILLDTHFHTIYSDGLLNIEQAVNWHIAMGFNAFFITDHDTLENQEEITRLKEKYKGRILIMQGLEYTADYCHINILGLKTFDFNKYRGLPPTEKLRQIIIDAHHQGAVVSINHYPWSIGGARPRIPIDKHPTREQALELGFDLIESVNWDDDISTIDMESYQFCKKNPQIAPVVGTDVHSPEKDRLYGWTLVHVNEFTEAALMEELRCKRTEILFQPYGVPYPTKHQETIGYRICKPLNQIAEMFIQLHRGGRNSNVKWGEVGVWIIYFIYGFIILEGYFYFIS